MSPKQTLKFLLLFILFHISAYAQSDLVFLGISINENDAMIPHFLKCVEKLDYDKSRLQVQLNVYNTSSTVRALVANWALANKRFYKDIKCIDNGSELKSKVGVIERNRFIADIKDSYLAKSKELGCGYCFILSSEIFIFPQVLKHLTKLNLPIVAPMLRPIPEPGDTYRNFFPAITESGYFQNGPDYNTIANRQKVGTFKLPCVHGAYLIQCKYVDKLNFTRHFTDWEFLAFSKMARENNVDQYLCNEKEFGFLTHFKGEKSIEEQKNFVMAISEVEINSNLIESLLQPYLLKDPDLKSYVNSFIKGDYGIYQVNNRDLFYIDGVNDYIKNTFIKRGLSWEESIMEQFKKYVKPGSVALDIGGHIGTHTLNLSRIVGASGRVHAFEPQAKMFCELAVNMHLNHCENVILHHRALGSEEKQIEMVIPEEWWAKGYGTDFVNEGHGTVKKPGEISKGDKAQMVRLDSFKLNNVSFIKVDVEGFEMDVLAGALETIKRNMPVMIIEIFKGAEQLQKIKQIESLGYKHSLLGGDDILFVPT